MLVFTVFVLWLASIIEMAEIKCETSRYTNRHRLVCPYPPNQCSGVSKDGFPQGCIGERERLIVCTRYRNVNLFSMFCISMTCHI